MPAFQPAFLRGLCFPALLSALGGLFLAECLDASIEATLVPGGGVLVQHAFLHALVDRGHGGAVLLSGGLGIALLDGFTEGAQRAADTGTVSAVHRGPGFSLTGALERGYMVRHEKV